MTCELRHSYIIIETGVEVKTLNIALRCDGCKAEFQTLIPQSLLVLRVAAELQGWISTPGPKPDRAMDYCPKCAEKMRGAE